VIIAVCSAINLPEQSFKAIFQQDDAAFGANAHQSAAFLPSICEPKLELR